MNGKSKARTPKEYIDSLSEPRKSEIQKLDQLIRKTVPKLEPHIMVGMLGYGKYRYKSSSGREGDWSVIGLASQKNYISLYICAVNERGYLAEQYKSEFPKANIGRSCVRFKKTADVDLKVMAQMLREAGKLGGMAAVKK